MSSPYEWQPPTPEGIKEQLEAHLATYSWIKQDDQRFPYLYDHKVGEEGESYEVLPGLMGRISNFYVDHLGALWHGSQVWILCSDAEVWLAQQE